MAVHPLSLVLSRCRSCGSGGPPLYQHAPSPGLAGQSSAPSVVTSVPTQCGGCIMSATTVPCGTRVGRGTAAAGSAPGCCVSTLGHAAMIEAVRAGGAASAELAAGERAAET